MLKPWWDAGWCPRGLAWAVDHHPDRPDHHRGCARTGATDLVAVIGHRLAPWRNRHRELPASLAGLPFDYLAHQGELAARAAATGRPDRPVTNPDAYSRATHRAQLRAQYKAERAARQAAR